MPLSFDLSLCPSYELEVSSRLKGCNLQQFPLDRGNSSAVNETVDAFTRVLYTGDAPTEEALFLVEGGPGFSNFAFIPMADAFLSMNPSWTIYLQDHRGTGLSSAVNCAANPSFYFAPENTTEYEECNDYIISAYGSKLSYYNAYNAAMDLKDTINEINPSKVGIYALSYGTYFTNTYMQLPGARYDAIVLDGPLPSNRWLMESNSLWNSKVSQDLISLCVKDSSVCRESLDSMGHLPQLLMDSVIDGSLPCLSKLPWLREKGGIDLLRNYNNYMTATKDAQVLIGPFWYRMHRCNDDDAEQLNHFHLMRVEAHKYRSPTYDYSYGLGVNIVASELYTQSSPNVSLTYDDQLLLVSRQFSDGGGQYTNSFARDKSNWPLYQPNLISESFSNTTVPVLILIGTLDPNTQFGLGPWLRDALGKNTLLVEVPYATHGTLTPTDTCVQSIITEFFSSWGESVDTDCTANYVTPDFDGSGKDAQGISMYMFGTADVWNNGYLLDDKPSTSSDCSWKEQDTVFIVFCVTCAVCFASTAIILAVYIHYKKLTKKPLSESKL